MTALALDTSVAIPLLVQSHLLHAEVARWRAGRPVTLAGHALVETYSVLTRLPGDLRLPAVDAARLIATRFDPPLLLGPGMSRRLPEALAERGIVGGAVYDALVALAAIEHGARLVTLDSRARRNYARLGADVIELR